jgi:hypothetical protein
VSPFILLDFMDGSIAKEMGEAMTETDTQAESPISPIDTYLENPVGEPTIIEFMGHVRLVGFVSEVELFGQKFVRVDFQKCDEAPRAEMITQTYNPTMIYRITGTTVYAVKDAWETARKVYRPYRYQLEHDEQLEGDDLGDRSEGDDLEFE